MPKYLDTRGNQKLTIAVCGRCSVKMPIGKLSRDPNIPALFVCPKCKDQYDPWRLPAPQTENITVPNPRPDEPLE